MDDSIDWNFISESIISSIQGGDVIFFSPDGSWKELLSLELIKRPEPRLLLETIIKESDGILKINHQLKSNDFELILSTTIEQFKDIIEVDPCNPSLNVEVFVQKCKAEDYIRENIEMINKRDLESAVKCIDDAFSTREVVLKSYIASINKSHDNLITSFRDQLTNYRKEFTSSHDSFHLLSNSVDLEYNNLKEKKLSAIRQLFADSKNLCQALKHVQENPMAWTLSKMNHMIAVYKTPNFRARIQKDLRIIDTTFDRVCETAFKIFKSRSTMQKKDQYIFQLDDMKEAIFNWKKSIVSSSEEWVNSLLVIKDNCSIEYLEELHLQLSDLQNMRQNLDLYKMKLDHLSRSSALGLDRFRHHCRYDEDAAQTMVKHHNESSDPSKDALIYSHPYSIFYHWNGGEGNDDHGSKVIQPAEKERCKMLMGTRIRSLGILADVSLEQVEAVLIDLIRFL